MNEKSICIIDRQTLFLKLEKYLTEYISQEKKLAILLLKISNFRQVNIVYGYQVADQLLNEFSHRLHNAARKQDNITRIGNAEFIMILPEIINEGHVTLAANKILNTLNQPFLLSNNKHKIKTNIGIAMFPDHAIDTITLMQRAELALVNTQQAHEAFSIYKPKDQQNYFDNWSIEDDLINALEHDEFQLYFQPQINLKTGELFGAEALIRWNNKNKGFIRPDIFIPISEDSGQIEDITWWTIHAALRCLKNWPHTDVILKVAVNLSAKVLNNPDLFHSISSALNIWGVEPERLTLEVTESALMDDMESSFIALDELRSFGLNVSIDDFGTGYSSMAYFKYIPANELKIDQSFIRYMLENDMDQHIVKTVIDMAHGFNIKVVAEGIENEQTLLTLKKIGCDIAQGYYIARPMPQDKFILWLNNYQSTINCHSGEKKV